MSDITLWVHGAVILVAALVSAISFALLIPLESVQSVTGVTILLSLSYGIAFLAWLLVLRFTKDAASLTWLNTHLLFLVVLPATIGATAMNVTSIQNTRNLLAGQIVA